MLGWDVLVMAERCCPLGVGCSLSLMLVQSQLLFNSKILIFCWAYFPSHLSRFRSIFRLKCARRLYLEWYWVQIGLKLLVDVLFVICTVHNLRLLNNRCSCSLFAHISIPLRSYTTLRATLRYLCGNLILIIRINCLWSDILFTR